jgi:hypothetical protein
VDAAEEEYTPPGPGLPGFVHRISGPAWVFVGLAAAVAIARLDTLGLLKPDHSWSIDDGFSLAALLGTVLLVLVPVFLLQRRPAAWSEDRVLAVAAIVVAAQPLLRAVMPFVRDLVFPWLATGDDVEVGLDSVQTAWVLLAVPGWLLGLVVPLLIVWGFDRLDDRPQARFSRSRVVLAIGLVIVLLLGAMAGAVVLAEATGTEVSFGWSAIASEVPSLALSAAWTWAALAALASGRAQRGRWWTLLLMSVILTGLVPVAVASLASYLGMLSVEHGSWSDVTSVLLWLDGVAIAAGAMALAGAFASVPRASIASAPPDQEDRAGEP